MLRVGVPRTGTSTTASMLSASLRILELRPEAACNCASKRLMFLATWRSFPGCPPRDPLILLLRTRRGPWLLRFRPFAVLAICRPSLDLANFRETRLAEIRFTMILETHPY